MKDMMQPVLKLTGLFLLTTLITCETNSQLSVLRKVYEQCSNQTNVMKCLKIKALKFTEKAMKPKKLEIFGWVDVLHENTEINRTARLLDTVSQSEENLQKLDEENINDLLYESANNFLESHVVSFNLPKLVQEARGRRKKNRFAGPFVAALAIKGVIMSMAYKGIAVMAGTALIIGKMALVLAAILGLKKMIGGEKEKTTLEIIKHPTHSTSHSYTSSFEEGEGHYHRSMTSAEDMIFLDSLTRNIF